jgi:hypothetical protein
MSCDMAGGGATIWERILRHKAPVVEPRESSAFAAAIADYQVSEVLVTCAPASSPEMQ